MVTSNFTDIERTTHYLMLNSYFLEDTSLWYGQTGIALAFYDYFIYTENQIYSDFVSFLIDNISKRINRDRVLSFASGLLGIGWGIEHLIQKGFIKGESVEICEEIDQVIMEFNLERFSDLSLENGIEGLLHYVIYHLQGAIKQESKLPFDNEYLYDLYKLCIKLEKQDISESLGLLLNTFKTFYLSMTLDNYKFSTIDFTAVTSKNLERKISFYPLGLRNGLAGILLYNIWTK